jgi:hypothetical protein
MTRQEHGSEEKERLVFVGVCVTLLLKIRSPRGAKEETLALTCSKQSTRRSMQNRQFVPELNCIDNSALVLAVL